MRAVLSVLLIMGLCGECAAYLSSGKGYSAGVYPPSSIIRFDGTNLNITQRNWSDADAGIGTKYISSPKDLWVGDFYHALYERSRTANVTVPTAPSWYRSERTMLVAYKAKIVSLLPSFAKTGTNTFDIDAWCLSNKADSSLNFVTNITWNKTVLCNAVGAPTNYLDNTPYRDLAGHTQPPTTNNSYVYAPYSDADYGWKYMQSIVSQLTTTIRFGMQGSNRDYRVGWSYVTNDPPWLELCEKAGHVSTGWTSPLDCEDGAGVGTAGSWGQTSENFGGFWDMVLRTSKIDAWVDRIYTNMEVSAPITVLADVYFGAALDGASNGVYSFSSPWTETGLTDRNNATEYIGKQIDDMAPNNGAAEYRIRIVNMERAPEPADPEFGLIKHTGYRLNGFSMFLLRWSYHY